MSQETLTFDTSSDLPEASMTPMMQHYWETKKCYPGCVLFYRLGDFYELFFDDAVQVAGALNLTLTKRGKHEQQDIPMCGVPVSHYEAYLNRLVHHGFRVAVCEQMEDPAEAKKRGAKGMVRRQVVRVVTRGTLTEDALLSPTQYNYLVALSYDEGEKIWRVAYADISTGAFWLEHIASMSLHGCLYRLNPSEILIETYQQVLVSESLMEWSDRLVPQEARLDAFPRWPESMRGALQQLTKGDQRVVSMILRYVEQTQVETLPRLEDPKPYQRKGVMDIDAATLRNLEIEHSFKGEKDKGLIHVIDRTLTPQGGRLLRARIHMPLAQPDGIEHRLNHVSWWVQETLVCTSVRSCLKHIPDFQRIVGRVAVKRATPRDLKALADGLTEVAKLVHLLKTAGTSFPRELQKSYEVLENPLTIHALLEKALAETLPASIRDGGVIRPGYHAQLDTLRQAEHQGRHTILELQERYIQETGVSTLKVRHNNIVGYYVEVPASQKSKIGPSFMHRQTLSNAVRYTTVELHDLEKRVMASTQEALALELQLFDQLMDAVMDEAEALHRYARSVAVLDVSAGLADLAVTRGYTRPLIDASLTFHITGGWHPVIEALMPKKTFIRNDCCLNPEQRLWLMTGPNMGGKSTFLRQTALIVLMAQMGSFVPAEQAHIGVVDRLLSRVGASDDLARGHSTFMVEMMETATILDKATPHSFVILDEIGRGTSTQDGLALAWAILEYLHQKVCCRALFATHYHELTHLESQIPALKCYTAQIQEWQNQVIFLHRMVPGVAERSFGLHVATMAGLPEEVVTRAAQLLQTWHEDAPPEQGAALSLSSTQAPVPSGALESSVPHPVVEALQTLNPDRMTAKEALDWIYWAQSQLY